MNVKIQVRFLSLFMSQTEQWVGHDGKEQWQTRKDMVEANVNEMVVSVTFRGGACLHCQMIYFIKP